MRWAKIIAPIAVIALLAAGYFLWRRKPEKPPPPMRIAVARIEISEITDSLQVGRHVFRVGKHSDTEGSLDIQTDGKIASHLTGALFSLKDFTDEPAGWKNGTDINGDSIPEVLVQESTGGAHCCISWRIFRAGADVRQIYEFDNGHTDFFPLVDVKGDGKFELQIFDWTFAYWKTGFASSPAMRLIYAWQNGTYAFSPELTRKPPLTQAELKKKAAELDWEQSEPEAGAPAQFWSDMLDLINNGNANQLAAYVELAWPAGRPGKSDFLTAFAKQLHVSKHWDDVNRLNGGNLEAALPK